MKILGNLGVTTGGPYEFNSTAAVKTLRDALFAGAATAIAFLQGNITGIDFFPNSTLDEVALIPLLAFLLAGANRFLTDYSK
jgi:hypothetical protein